MSEYNASDVIVYCAIFQISVCQSPVCSSVCVCQSSMFYVSESDVSEWSISESCESDSDVLELES